jgi:hypothetical protein
MGSVLPEVDCRLPWDIPTCAADSNSLLLISIAVKNRNDSTLY